MSHCLASQVLRVAQIRPRDYLGAILPGLVKLADFPAKSVAELAPLAWMQCKPVTRFFLPDHYCQLVPTTGIVGRIRSK